MIRGWPGFPSGDGMTVRPILQAMIEDDSRHYGLIKRQSRSHHSFPQQRVKQLIKQPRSEFMPTLATQTTTPATPTIGIIGSGAMGSAIAPLLARHGIPATLSNSRGPDSLKDRVRELGPSIQAGTREEAAAKDIVFVAVNWGRLPAALAGLPNFGGRIVVDTNNPIEAPLFKPAELHGRLSSEVVA